MTPREELEARLTALLLGELSADEAAALRQAIAQDAELARLHDRLQQAIALVRETVAAPEHETAAIADAPKLSGERREKLLAAFKIVKPKELKRSRWPKVNWGQVKWREYAALAAMVVGLLGVGAVLMNQLIDESRETGALGLRWSFSQAPQRLTTIAGMGPSAAAPAMPAELFDTLNRETAASSSSIRAALQSDSSWEVAGVPMPSGGVPANSPASPDASRRGVFRSTLALPEIALAGRGDAAANSDGALAGTGFTASLWGNQMPPAVDNKIQISGQAPGAPQEGRFGKEQNFATFLGEAPQTLAQRQPAESTQQFPTPAPAQEFGDARAPRGSDLALGVDAMNSSEGRTRHFAVIALPDGEKSIAAEDGRTQELRESDRAVRQANLAFKGVNFDTLDGQEVTFARPVITAGAAESARGRFASEGDKRGGAHGGGGFGGGSPRSGITGGQAAPATSWDSGTMAADDFIDVNRNSRVEFGEGMVQQKVSTVALASGGTVASIVTPPPVMSPPPVAATVASRKDDGAIARYAWKFNGASPTPTTPAPAKPASPSEPQVAQSYGLAPATGLPLGTVAESSPVVMNDAEFATAAKGYSREGVNAALAADPAAANYSDLGVSTLAAQLASGADKTLGDIADRTTKEAKSSAILSGDFNVSGPSTPAPTRGVGAWDEQAADANWSYLTSLHNNQGNIGLGDGSVAQVTPSSLRKQASSQLQDGLPTATPMLPTDEFASVTFGLTTVQSASGKPAVRNDDFDVLLVQPGEKTKPGVVYSVSAVGHQPVVVDARAKMPVIEKGLAPVEKFNGTREFLDGNGLAATVDFFTTADAGAKPAPPKGDKPADAAGLTVTATSGNSWFGTTEQRESRLGIQYKQSLAKDEPVPKGYVRANILNPTKADTKPPQLEVESLAELTKAAASAEPSSVAAMRGDVEQSISKSKLNQDWSRKQLETELEEEVKTVRHRVDNIALPQGERGEALEKLRVAAGPIVVNEVMYDSPNAANTLADGLVTIVATNAAILPAANSFTTITLSDGQQSDALSGLADAATRTAGLESLNRQLETSLAVRDRLQTRLWSEKVDAAMPKTAVVEVIETAEAQPAQPVSKPNLWGRISGAFSSDTERTARISVEKDATDIETINGKGASTGFDPYWVQSQFEKIQSKAVLEKAAEKLNLNEAWAGKLGSGEKLKTEDTIKRLKKMLDVSQSRNTSLIEIKARSDDPEEAARIANAVAEAYQESRLTRWRDLSKGGLQALESETAEHDKKIAELQGKLAEARVKLKPAQADVPLPKLAAGAAVPQPEVATAENAFSTFSLNVSDVSFKLAAASLEKGQMPDPATVRSEEFINAFDYRDPEPKGSAPIAFAWERARYPFAHDRDLLRFSVKTAASGRQPGRPLNLVLLLDNSGSMERADRVRIREACLRVLAGQLRPEDRVSVVAFARTARLVVDGFSGKDAGNLPQVIGQLAPDGGTNLEEAMNLAYQTALKHFLANGVNRVVLLTDGAANLGDVQPESLKKKVEAHRQQGVALDCFGIGWDGLNDELLEALSRNGDGRYGFVNTPDAAQSEFAGQLAGALKVAASDVKVQVEWNPRRVTAYRQIGYAKHQLKKEQFRDNTVDAAEIGAAEAGNALYTVQVNPRGEGPLGTVRVRFKVPGTSDYREHEWPLAYEGNAKSLDQSSPALRLAASASAFSEWLVSSPFAAEVTPDKLLGYLGGAPETWPADPRPKKLEWMIRQAKSVAGK